MLTFEGKEVRIKKSFRRGMRLYVDGKGDVVVETGYYDSFIDDDILKFIDKHKRFLRNRLNKFAANIKPELSDGGRLSVLDNVYTVVRNSSVDGFAVSDGVLYVPEKFTFREAADFFGGLLYPFVDELTARYAKKYEIDYSGIDLYVRQTAWGTHYSQDNFIKYNVCLAFVSLDCIEYVVVHELCHSPFPNHGKAFWAAVKKILPNYDVARKKLRDGYSLSGLIESLKSGY